MSHVVELPDAGALAEAGALCSVAAEVVADAARVELVDFTFTGTEATAKGIVTVPADVLARIVGDPTLELTRLAGPDAPVTSNWQRTATGFAFAVTWPQGNAVYLGATLSAVVRFAFDCGDATVQTVTAATLLELCEEREEQIAYTWVSSGDECKICRTIAEMAPSPVVSDNTGDDLPLGRVVRLRVVELARAGNQALLFAESDAGEHTEYAWNVSCGTLQQLDADLVLWTLPDAREEVAFGQLGVWNDHGAAVENFLWSAA